MKMLLRQLFAPALFAATLMPMAFTAQADSRGYDREQMVERMEDRRQEVYQRAELSEEQQHALNEAHTQHREAIQALHDEHRARIANILTEEEQQAMRKAMHDVHREHRSEYEHSKRDYHRRPEVETTAG